MAAIFVQRSGGAPRKISEIRSQISFTDTHKEIKARRDKLNPQSFIFIRTGFPG